MANVKDVRQFKGQIGGTVRLGADPATGYVDVSVRVSDTDPRVKPHLDALRSALATVASEQVLGATADTVKRAEESTAQWKARALQAEAAHRAVLAEREATA
jgi:hypothetical protein